MPLYTYECDGCGDELQYAMTFAEHDAFTPVAHAVPVDFNHANDRDNGGDQGLTLCGRYKQVLNFHYGRPMPEHYSDTLDTVVKSERHYKDTLKRQAEEYSARTGLETTFETVDPTDPAAAGVKGDDGFESQARAHHDAASDGHKHIFV